MFGTMYAKGNYVESWYVKRDNDLTRIFLDLQLNMFTIKNNLMSFSRRQGIAGEMIQERKSRSGFCVSSYNIFAMRRERANKQTIQRKEGGRGKNKKMEKTEERARETGLKQRGKYPSSLPPPHRYRRRGCRLGHASKVYVIPWSLPTP